MLCGHHRLVTEYRTDSPPRALSEVTEGLGNSRGATPRLALNELPLLVNGRSENCCALATNSTSIRWLRSGGDTMLITEIGYLLLALSAVAVLLFCWLGLASITNLHRDK